MGDAVRLYIPDADVADPELSIVVPALNEESTIEAFVDWCQEGIRKAAVRCEILIVDSSTDKTAERALARGARVLKTPRRGLGRAYRDAIPFVRGKYVLMGDADCTYDFREVAPFLEQFRAGHEYVMGSRMRGYIEPDSMPWLHRYFGTPITTWFLNVIYGSRFSDIHCGMRGITLEALVRMRLQSDGWEYASEMVLRSVQMKLRTAEVPVHFLRDPEGRVSHHKRSGWTSPWKAAWTNVRSMLTYGAHYVAFWPSFVCLLAGVFLTVLLAPGPVTIGRFTLSLYWMLVGATLTILGAQSLYLACLSEVLNDYTGEARKRWVQLFTYNRAVIMCGITALVGIGLALPLVRTYIQWNFTLPVRIGAIHHLAIAGLDCVMFAFTSFTFTLVLHAIPSREVRPND